MLGEDGGLVAAITRIGAGRYLAGHVSALNAKDSKLRYLLGELIEARQPVVFFLCQTAVGNGLCSRRFGIRFGREDRVVAIQASFGAIFNVQTSPQLLGNRLLLRLGRGRARLG